MAELASAAAPSVVLVHGGFVDGSGWQPVYKILTKDGYAVSIVQNPTISLADDVAATKRVSCRAERSGNSCRPLLRRSSDHRSRQRSEGCRRLSISPRLLLTRVSRCLRSSKIHQLARLCLRYCRHQDGYLLSTGRSFAPPSQLTSTRRKGCVHGRFAGPVGLEALSGAIEQPAWKTKPSWYMVTTDDKMIPPPAQRFMSKRAGSTVVEVAGSHAIYESQPNAVAALVQKAVEEVKVEATMK